MTPTCPHCNEAHVPTYKCNAYMANTMANGPSNMANVQTGSASAKASSPSQSYKYRDPEKRREYMRAYMKRKRAGAPST